MTRYEKIKSVLEGMDTAEIIAVHNEYCNETNNMDDYIYAMCEFDEIMNGMEPWEIARACFYGHEFCPAHDYFRFNGYANLESFDFAPEGNSGIYISDIADYIDRNGISSKVPGRIEIITKSAPISASGRLLATS